MNDGGPAFAVAFPVRGSEVIKGMSLRDYFAAKAMNGMLASQADGDWELQSLARVSYACADAMLIAGGKNIDES